jgi:hypothetical protein
MFQARAKRESPRLLAVSSSSLNSRLRTPSRFEACRFMSSATREFCANCGTHLTTRRTDLPFVILKIGTLDDPSLYDAPQMAIYTLDKQPFHLIPEGLPAFERLPPR